jgi:hypothetical protein
MPIAVKPIWIFYPEHTELAALMLFESWQGANLNWPEHQEYQLEACLN